MSFSLEILNGDLSLSGTSLATVTGAHKLTQDLACAILTPLGFDESNPEFGSAIDGGTNPQGEYIESIIGDTDWNLIATRVQSEIERICTEYQREQIARNREDATRYGKSTLTPGEILVSVEGIRLIQAQDKLLVIVSLMTGNETVELKIPLES